MAVVEAATPVGDQTSGVTPKGFLEDDEGKKSSMRLMSFVALISAIVFGGLTVLATLQIIGSKATEGGDAVLITFGFLVSAFAPKAVQKFAEAKVPSPK